MNRIRKYLAIACVVLLASCGGGGSGDDTPQQPQPVTFDVTVTKSANADALGYEPQNRSFAGGEFVTNTGVWGIAAASSYWERMYGTLDPVAQTATLTAEWDVTSSDKPGVVLFANVTWGLHPGWEKSTTTKLPVKVSEMPPITITGNSKTVCITTCLYNTSFDVFLMSSNRTNNNDIGTELMIHTSRSIEMATGSETTVINGVTYYVMYESFETPWITIVYMPEINTKIEDLNINVRDFIQDAVKRGYVNPEHYLVSVEHGTEVINGKGVTTIKDLKIQ